MEKARDEAIKARAEAEKAKEQAEEIKEQVEQEAYELGVAETETNLKAQVPGVCKLYCFQVQVEALNQAGVEASSELMRAENVYYPPAIQESAPTSSEANTAPETAKVGQGNVTNAPTPLDKPAEDIEHPRVSEKDKSINQETPQDVVKSPADPQALITENEALDKMEIVLASLAVPIQAVPSQSQGSEASDTAFQQPPKDKLTIKLKKQAEKMEFFFFFFFFGYLENFCNETSFW